MAPGEDVLADLLGQCDAMEAAVAAGDFTRVAQLNSLFHAAVIDASRNRRLPAMLTSVMHAPLIVGTFRRYDAGEMARSMNHHRELVAAMAARDPDWAESVMRAHIRAAAANLSHDANEAEDER